MKETDTLTLKQIRKAVKDLKENEDKLFAGYHLWFEDNKIFGARCDKSGKTYGKRYDLTNIYNVKEVV